MIVTSIARRHPDGSRSATAASATMADSRMTSGVPAGVPATATLPPRVGKWTGAGGLRTLNGVARFVPFNAVWNHLGNPAMTLPSGMSSSGMPLSVQIVARPRGEETLLSLAGQVERVRPWADRRPPLT